MDATCLHVLHSLVVSKLGKEGVKIVIPNVKKAESEIAAFLWEQRSDPSLTCSFIVGRKTWKSKNLYSYRMQGRIVEVCSGRKGEAVDMNGQASAYPFSFICCVVPPRPTLTMGSVTTDSPLAMTFPVNVKGKNISVLFDSGASHSFIKSDTLQGLGVRYKPSCISVTLADGSVSDTKGTVDVSFTLKLGVTSRHNFIVSPAMIDGVDMILGQDWMEARGASIDFRVKAAQFRHHGKWVTLTRAHSPLPVGPKLVWGLQAKERKEGRKDRTGRGWKGQDVWKVCLYTVLVNEQAELVDITGEDASNGVHLADPDPYVDDTPIVTKPTSGTGMTFTQQINDMLEGKPQALKELLLTNEDLFAKQLPGLPPEREVFHTINLEEGHRPPNRPAYRLAPSELAECEKTVDELLKLGLIRPSCSPFASPVLFVRKKDGSLRMVIDYRLLNKITISDRYPLPRIDDLLDRLKGAKVFSSLDLLSGYHQVRLRKEDVPKTAFRTPFGLYEFLVLPFGLTNAPATFQRLMNEVFHDYIREGFVVVYLDDVLIYSKTEEEHLGQLERVFTRPREHQLLAKLVKCSFFEKQLRYLGHIIGENGLEVDMDKVKVVQEWPSPTNVTEVRRFLGLSNYFRKFIQNYSILATPLTALSGAKAPWKWGQEQQEAFTKIKEALVRAPILTLPDVRRPFKVVCDACDYGVGAVLFQDGKVCAYFSKKLGASERNYSATERELLAVVYALTEWRCYLLGKPVTVVTDHKCNTFLGQQVGLSPRRARWAERLQEFEIEWVWEPGKTNIADPLSRCFTQHGHPGSGGRDNGVVAGAALRRKRTHPSPDSLTPSSLDAARSRKVRKVTEPAQEVQDPLGTMEQIGLASPSELTPDTDGYETLLGKLGKAYADDPWLAVRANRRKVSLKGGFWERNGRKYVPALFEERKNGEVVVQNLRRGIVEALHDPPHVGHPGVTRMYELLTREWYWPGMYEDVKAYLAHCDSCQGVKGHLGKSGVGSADELVRKMGLDIRRAQKFLAAAQDRQTAYANRRRSDASFAPVTTCLWIGTSLQFTGNFHRSLRLGVWGLSKSSARPAPTRTAWSFQTATTGIIQL
jgi:hypothetical protein